MKKKKQGFREICETMAVLMAIKEQTLIQGSLRKPAKIIKLAIGIDGNDRTNYFFNQLYNEKRPVKELEMEFRTDETKTN